MFIAAGVIRTPLFEVWSWLSMASSEVFRFVAQVGPGVTLTVLFVMSVILVPAVMAQKKKRSAVTELPAFRMT